MQLLSSMIHYLRFAVPMRMLSVSGTMGSAISVGGAVGSAIVMSYAQCHDTESTGF